MAKIHDLSALEQSRLLSSGELSPLEITEHYLARIDRLNEQLGAFVTVTADRARDRASKLAGAPASRHGAIFGLPFGDKDLSARAGVRCMYGSRLMAEFVPDFDDEIVSVLDAAGGVSLGKTNTPEFGLPSYTETLVAPPARTPWDPSRGAGGSSGGAAVAVAAGMLPFAPGSDGGGSIRIPAAACGLVGLKPSRGLVAAGSGQESLGGLAVAGPLARTVEDAALLLDAMTPRGAGGRLSGHYTLRAPDSGPFLEEALNPIGTYRLAVMTTSAWDNAYDITVEQPALDALDVGVRTLRSLGHDFEERSLAPFDEYAEAFRVIWQAGAASIPADGDALALVEPLTAWLIGRGRQLHARTLAEALSTLKRFERAFIAQFAAYDAVLTPTLAMVPRPIGWYDSEDGENNFAQQVRYTPFTSMVNVTGLPAITLPVHYTAEGLPMGVQLIGRPGGEATLLKIGAQVQQELKWQERRPECW